MTADEFKARIEKCDDAIDIDNACCLWLELALADNGKEGKIGIHLLKIIQNELMP